jgi:hypothetical protein
VKAIPVLCSDGSDGVRNAAMEVAVGEHVSDCSTGRELQVAEHYGAVYGRFAFCLRTQRMQTYVCVCVVAACSNLMKDAHKGRSMACTWHALVQMITGGFTCRWLYVHTSCWLYVHTVCWLYVHTVCWL